MSSQIEKRVLVVAGLGNGTGTGAATARLFSSSGYSVALIARGATNVEKIADDINKSGGHAVAFPVASYSDEDVTSAWAAIHARFPKPEYAIRAALFNASHGVWKPFLETNTQDVQDCIQTNVAAAFSFSRGAILAFKENDIDQSNGKRGALIITGATASVRGHSIMSAFAAGKFGKRALSQSLAKEFGKDNIQVAHVIIDGGILTNRAESRPAEWKANKDAHITPEGIASSYLYLVNQDRSAWTWEIDRKLPFFSFPR
ncbi:hypothetical protein HYPSUDRAFT_148349 [Hypholoma sublateritium FD-334 SS-4]|uniref:Uncharacterized protein n=1 Tax=Hypholoma sublateritium (strain FD-334 SS-4) TaxID=945553 RepID=A0A0D2P6L0_HYPSF|nr:hypothetical protein HYPSUDRAFT_148349 [Hypholoma sublateritium FD-334 SS-4]